MIDNYAKAMELMRRMEAHLPIPAQPTGACRRVLRAQGVKLARHRPLQIKRVFYMGDEGGICCDVTPSPDAKEAIIVSITHLRVDAQHPLATEIRAYQTERVRKLARLEGSGEPSAFMVRPRKSERRKR
jgi:hypothetical protein